MRLMLYSGNTRKNSIGLNIRERKLLKALKIYIDAYIETMNISELKIKNSNNNAIIFNLRYEQAVQGIIKSVDVNKIEKFNWYKISMLLLHLCITKYLTITQDGKRRVIGVTKKIIVTDFEKMHRKQIETVEKGYSILHPGKKRNEVFDNFRKGYYAKELENDNIDEEYVLSGC